jgi:hypothetical protein
MEERPGSRTSSLITRAQEQPPARRALLFAVVVVLLLGTWQLSSTAPGPRRCAAVAMELIDGNDSRPPDPNWVPSPTTSPSRSGIDLSEYGWGRRGCGPELGQRVHPATGCRLHSEDLARRRFRSSSVPVTPSSSAPTRPVTHGPSRSPHGDVQSAAVSVVVSTTDTLRQHESAVPAARRSAPRDSPRRPAGASDVTAARGSMARSSPVR